MMLHQFKVVVEQHPDGYVAYPLGLKGVIVSQGETYEEVLVEVESAIRFHIETFGATVLETDGSATPLTIPNHRRLKGSTLRTMLSHAGIARDEFLNAYENT